MEFKSKKFSWVFYNGEPYLHIAVPLSMKQQIQDFILNQNDKEYNVTIKQHREKRSLDANGYAWHLINELANVMRISKDECYLLMLKRYGQHSVVSVQEEAVEMLLKSVKYCEVFAEGEIKGKKFKHIKIYAGSSTYDSREMAILIDGIISECKELGIETATPDEIKRMKGEWGNG